MTEALVYSFALLVAGLVLLWLEVLVVSFGLLSVAALACLAGSIYFGFQVAPALGWVLVVLVPAISVGVLLHGVRRVGRSRLVMREEVAADAGYHHAASALGIAVGDVGVMVTPGMPSGRARFRDGGDGATECDVRARGGSLAAGDRVRVLSIEGAAIAVAIETES